MLLGFALVCSVNLLCFFPQTLFSDVAPGLYRLYNLSAGLAIVGGSLLCTLISLSKIRRPEKGMLVVGYACLSLGMVSSYLVDKGSADGVVIATGIACGFGIGLLMVCWFSFLSLIPERYAMLTQGGQALLGSVVFVLISTFIPRYSFVGALVCLAVSAVLSIVIYRKGAIPDSGPIPQDSLRTSLRVFSEGGALGRSFSTALFAFVVISLLYGIITAVIMSPENNTNALNQATWGGIIGATLFLFWAFFSKKRAYGFVIKGFFGVLAFVLILPIEGHGIITAMGYQLICLLFFSLVIDSFSASRRVLLLILSLSYAITRGVFLLGLYVPGHFGVSSYADFFDSASLLVFLVYMVFIALLFILNRERRQAKRSEENTRSRPTEEDRILDDLPDGEEDSLEEVSSSLNKDIALASEVLGKRYGLTKRETEVLGYFARGRDVAFVCDELYLSRHTVKSYTKTIYAKLDVHSRQELIDAVEHEIELLGDRSLKR